MNKEEQVIKNQLERHEKNKVKLEKSLEYNEALIEKQKQLRAHDDQWREFLRNQKDESDQILLKQIEAEIENIKKHIKELKETKKTSYHG